MAAWHDFGQSPALNYGLSISRQVHGPTPRSSGSFGNVQGYTCATPRTRKHSTSLYVTGYPTPSSGILSTAMGAARPDPTGHPSSRFVFALSFPSFPDGMVASTMYVSGSFPYGLGGTLATSIMTGRRPRSYAHFYTGGRQRVRSGMRTSTVPMAIGTSVVTM